jgi:FHA domain
MATCPSGDETASTDFCDVCGIRMDAPPTPAPAPDGLAGSGPQAPEPAGPPCPRCGVPRTGQYCEGCGYAFDSAGRPGPAAPPAAGVPPLTTETRRETPGTGTRRATGWTALVAADRDYYDQLVTAGDVAAAAVQFPAYCPERRFPLTAPEMQIGRRSASRGLNPEIDLTGPPTDPGISRLHAVLIAEPDGTWAVIDPGSENGTLVNNADIGTGVRVPLRDGDRIHLGAWTTLTVQAP